MKPEAVATLRLLIALMERIGETDEAERLRELMAPPGSRQGGQEAEEVAAPVPSPAQRKDSRSRAKSRSGSGPLEPCQRAGQQGSPFHQVRGGL